MWRVRGQGIGGRAHFSENEAFECSCKRLGDFLGPSRRSQLVLLPVSWPGPNKYVMPVAFGAPDQRKHRDVGMKIKSYSFVSEMRFGRRPKTHAEVAPDMPLSHSSGTKHAAPTVSEIYQIRATSPEISALHFSSSPRAQPVRPLSASRVKAIRPSRA